MSEKQQIGYSRIYGISQTALVIGFGAAVFFDHSLPLFSTTQIITSIARAICLIGILIIGAAVYTLRRVIQIEPAPRQDGTLVTAGIYRWLRHPIYTAMLLEVIGLFLLYPRWLVAIMALAVMIYLVFKVRFEERLLMARYSNYASYKTCSFGLFPLIRG